MPLNNPIAGVEASSGAYVGNGAVNRAIPHGLSSVPKMVRILAFETATPTTARAEIVISDQEAMTFYMVEGSPNGRLAVTAMDSTNFYVGNATNYPMSANEATRTYQWKAIG